MEIFTPYNQILIFEEQLCMSNVDIFIFDIDQAQINSVQAFWMFCKMALQPYPHLPAS